MIRTIVITGPESTGKSSLCRQLAAHYQTAWVPEFARTYLEMNGPAYTKADLTTMARGQIDLEEKLVSGLPKTDTPYPVFIDTDLHTIRIWSEYVFGDCDPWILNRIAERRYDHYLLCDTDLPWEPDPLRENPDPAERRLLFHMYKDFLVEQGASWALIDGRELERVQKAILQTDRWLGF